LGAIERSPSKGIEELNRLESMLSKLIDHREYLNVKNKDIIFISADKRVDSSEVGINELDIEAVTFAVDIIREVNEGNT
jgi:uncharacterized protein (DUF1499 family)|tara:strand:- start:211 stop:447 length:237 start_codon:yes stop_codon:yes gene_type:complete